VPIRRWYLYAALIVAALATVPPALIARARTVRSPHPRVHLIQDMDAQPKLKTQKTSTFFADGRGLRPPVVGTVARGELHADDHLHRGKQADQWATTFPTQLTLPLLQRGRERFDVFCAPCHGLDGDGHGVVAVRAARLQEITWVAPASLHEPKVREQPVGQIFGTITDGLRTMPSYAAQVPVADRWAILAYVRALQRSQNATLEDVPPEARDELERALRRVEGAPLDAAPTEPAPRHAGDADH